MWLHSNNLKVTEEATAMPMKLAVVFLASQVTNPFGVVQKSAVLYNDNSLSYLL